MPKFCANISFLWKDLPIANRIFAAAGAGFGGVEILFPYDDPVQDIRAALDETGMALALINCPPPNYTGGPRGFAALPEAKDRFRSDIGRALRYARTLGAERLHIMSGAALGDAAKAMLIENLAYAAELADGFPLTIEVINSDDMPGYFLNDFDLAADVIAQVGADNLGLQFDAYHAHRITGDVMGTWDRFGPLVQHVQFADFPGRHEPGSGEIDLQAFFTRLDRDGYRGWASAEYVPLGDVDAGLTWLPTGS